MTLCTGRNYPVTRGIPIVPRGIYLRGEFVPSIDPSIDPSITRHTTSTSSLSPLFLLCLLPSLCLYPTYYLVFVFPFAAFLYFPRFYYFTFAVSFRLRTT